MYAFLASSLGAKVAAHPNRRRTQPLTRASAAQPPGSHDPTFAEKIPSHRGEAYDANDAGVVSHAARPHHPMSAYTFFAPPLSILGFGALRRLGGIVRDKEHKTCVLVTGDRRDDAAGVIPLTKKTLLDAGVRVEVYDEVEQNPTTQHVDAARIMCEEINADCIVSCGGSSCHDVAKLVRGLYRNDAGQTSACELNGVDMCRASSSAMVPHYAVSSTATSGSSSELTRLATICDPVERCEMSVVDYRLTPTVACIVTVETQQGNPELIAASGVLALAHAVEAYLSPASSPITDACALHSIRLISAHLRDAVFDANDSEARNMITFADYLAGTAFNSAGLGWVQGLSNALCAEYIAAPASECAGVFLPHVLRFYAGGSAGTKELFVDLAEAMGCPAESDSTEQAAATCVLTIARLVADLKLPETLRDLTARRRLGMDKKEITKIALRALRDTAAVTAARGASLGEMEELLVKAWDCTLSKASC